MSSLGFENDDDWTPSKDATSTIQPLYLEYCGFTMDDNSDATLCITAWGVLSDGNVVYIPTAHSRNIAVQAWYAISQADLEGLDTQEVRAEHLTNVVQTSIADSFSRLNWETLEHQAPVEQYALDDFLVPCDSKAGWAYTVNIKGCNILERFQSVDTPLEDQNPGNKWIDEHTAFPALIIP